MRVVVRGRRGGKTHRMVQWVLEGVKTGSYPFWNRVLVVSTINEADYLRRTWPELDYRQVFSWDEWRKARLGALPVEVAVDNADQVLAGVLGQSVSAISVTGSVEPSDNEPVPYDLTDLGWRA